MPTSVRREADMTADSCKFRGQGIAFTAVAGTSTAYDYRLAESRLVAGTRLILKNHTFGDSVRFQVVDVDNVLGYGAGLVLDEFATSWYVVEDKQDQGATIVSYSAEVVAGLYIRLVYTSVGGSNVSILCNLFAHKYMT